MTNWMNEAGEPLMTAAELRYEAYLDDEPRYEDDYDDDLGYDDDDHLTDVEADAMTLAGAGWGTEEDYGYYGEEDAAMEYGLFGDC